MIKRNASIVGLAAAAALLTGCAAQYRNPASCVAEMRSRLGDTSLGELSVTNRAVSYRGQRVVIEGTLKPAAASATASTGGAAAAKPASAAPGQPASGMADAGAPASGTVSQADGSSGATRAATAAGAASAPASTGSSTTPPAATRAATPAAASQPAPAHPTTPIGALVAHFSQPRKTTPTAAECTFDESGLTSFRWIAPADLAKTTAARPASHND
ncbi:hypothetical protein [Paraburkholderia caballeronis]|uniref:hypothetical protein n=1 Tax=Paraburkholderia caballeronis TaxID=416943 RepID=UPI0010657753|nr:hypothetical protein [Paraburkholderia caballeronis]TDV16260.1 hypothetical protein C7406_108118 [Paraburkholderia caballeronis]TDV20610.1 hypothetical protein C7408_101118 [Paraburkholderia caballeronis]TDV33078.1 hypothetical protein C7404_101214 [Paraburkholderia caballeronis]